MSEDNNPRGTDLNSAQQAISAILAPQEDTATEPEAPEVEATEEFVEEAYEPQSEPQGDEEVQLETEEYEDQDDDASFDLLAATVEVDGEEITVEELKRGNLRQRDYTRKTQELAEARKLMEAEYHEIASERAQYAQLLPALQQRLEQSEQEPDWDTLYDMDPQQAAKAERQWRAQQDQRKEQIEAVKAEQQRMQAMQQQQMAQYQEQYIAQQREVLPDIIPEWRDTKVRQRETGELRNFLLQEGFSAEDISGLANATLVKLARKAMLYDQGQTRATQAKAKPKPKSKTLKAGSRGSQPKPKGARIQALQRAQSGRVSDAAAAIKNLL